jgi:hypothetical protein
LAVDGIEEADLAALLAVTWHDYWVFAPVVGVGPGDRDLALSARAIYAATDGMLIAGEPDDDQALIAMSVLRELADGYALASYPWTAEKLEKLLVNSEGDTMPARGALERALSRHGVPAWAASLGEPLDVGDADEGDSPARPGDASETVDDRAKDVLDGLAAAFDGYRGAEELRARQAGRNALLEIGATLRDAACSNLILARRWLHYANERMSPEAVVACGAWRLSLQALFERASADGVADLEELSDLTDVLLRLLREGDAVEWLRLRGVDAVTLLDSGS